MTNIKGLWIDGKPVSHSTQDFQSTLKYALVSAKDQNRPAFRSTETQEVMALVDDLDLEIAGAMINDYLAHSFASPSALAANIALRKGVIAAMKALCAGDIDGDYVEAGVGVPPTLGYLRNLEVLYAKGAKTGQGILTKDAPFQAPDASWMHMPDTNSWTSFAFMQKPDVPLSKALADITPFRGECAGALQLSILTGCLNGLGAAEVDALRAYYGPAFIGVWALPGDKDTPPVNTVATQFFDQLHKVPKDYTRGAPIAVPGDFLYFKNKDDYSDRSQMGGWQGDPAKTRRGAWSGGWTGENCIYMGQDALGDPHYSGMGLAWKTEFALRMFLSNAYFTDANCKYLADRRAGKTSHTPPVIVEDAQTQVRFTARALIRYPDLKGTPPQPLKVPTFKPTPLSDKDIQDRFGDLGLTKLDTAHFTGGNLILGTVMDALHIDDSACQQMPGTDPTCADLMTVVGDWVLHFRAAEAAKEYLTAGDTVNVQATKHS